MDEQNNNPMNPYGTDEIHDPYGINNAQESGGTQNPYGMNKMHRIRME